METRAEDRRDRDAERTRPREHDFEERTESMANQKQPIDLLEYKGKKHLTKAEISERRLSEVKAPADNIEPPRYLNAAQREEFMQLAAELEPLDILSNLDTGELARYCVAHSLYQRYTRRLQQSPKKMVKRLQREAEENGIPISSDKAEELTLGYEAELAKLQGKYFDQCETCARSLGLNITSRCRLVIPKPPKEKSINKFERFEKQA